MSYKRVIALTLLTDFVLWMGLILYAILCSGHDKSLYVLVLGFGVLFLPVLITVVLYFSIKKILPNKKVITQTSLLIVICLAIILICTVVEWLFTNRSFYNVFIEEYFGFVLVAVLSGIIIPINFKLLQPVIRLWNS